MKAKIINILLTLIVMLPVAANASLLYENPWDSSAIDAGAFAQPGQLLAGEFSLAGSATVDNATWYGTMFSSDPLDTGDIWSFDVNFYTDAAGLPGALIGTSSVLASVIDTGIDIETERSYLFDAALTPLALAGGTSYWFSVVNTGAASTFRWTKATSGMNSALNIIGWEPWTDTRRTPVNFRLYGTVPEPTSLALLGIGLVGIGYNRKKAI